MLKRYVKPKTNVRTESKVVKQWGEMVFYALLGFTRLKNR